MATPVVVDRIQVPSSIVPGEQPPGTLKHGELWVNTADKIVYAGVDGGPAVPLRHSFDGDAGTYV